MGDISPAIASFLHAFQLQQENAAKARDYQLKKEHLDEVARQFAVTSKQAQQRIDLQNQMDQILGKVHAVDTEHKIQQAIQAGTFIPDQATTLQQPVAPGATSMQSLAPSSPQQGPGTDILSQLEIPKPGAQPFIEVPGISRPQPPSTTLPSVGAPITMNIPGYGPWQGNMPKDPGVEAVEQAKKMIPALVAQQTALSPGKIKEYEATVGQTKAADTAMKEQVALIHERYADFAAQLRKETNEATLEMRDAQQQYRNAMSVFNLKRSLGLTDNQELEQVVGDSAVRVRRGLINLSEVPPAQRPLVESTLAKMGANAPQGGTKFRSDLLANAQNGDTLLHDMQNINKEYPAASSGAGQAIRWAQGLNPLADVTQRFKSFDSNIVKHANNVGETPAMMRSVALAQKADNIGYKQTDSAQTRADKEKRVTDLILTKLSLGINSAQNIADRKEFWKDAIEHLPTLHNDYRYAQVLDKILATGKYESNWINSIK